jgi:hypothetical protein
MVFAVNWPAQAPAVGRQTRLIVSSSSSVAVPAMTCPIAVQEDRRHVATHHAHHQARHVLVAAADAENAVPLVAAHGGLDAVGDQLARDEREAHARMRDRQAVGHRHHRTFMRRAAAGIDAGLRMLGLLLQVAVARAHFAAGVDHADVRACDVVVVFAERAQEGARGRAQASAVHGF